MQVRVLFFGILRDGAGATEQWVELAPGDQTVGSLLRQLAAEASPARLSVWSKLAVAVNREYAQNSAVLQPGDEVALLPPVSGGRDQDATDEPSAEPSLAAPPRVLLTREPLATDLPVSTLKAGSDGAVVVFDGIVRNNTRGRQTQYLFYEAYESMALEKMRGLVAEACTRFPVRDALLHHRLGRLEIGETSVLIVVASAHRGAAFEACRWIIDTLKQTVPIWKKEFFVDGAVWGDGEPFPDALRPSGEMTETPTNAEGKAEAATQGEGTLS